jgi:hypothetical protein
MRSLIILTALLIGCNNYPDLKMQDLRSLDSTSCDRVKINLIVDESFSNSQKHMILNGLLEWSNRSGNTLDISYSTTSQKHNVKDVRYNTIVVSPSALTTGDLLGYTYYSSEPGIIAANIIIRVDIGDDIFAPVIAHEEGHAMQLQHNTDTLSIMYFGAYPGQRIEYNDLLAFNKLWGCKK